MGSLSGSLRARKRIHDAGLDDRCRVEVCDYRDIECAQEFDKIVSIGMFEHVGKAFLPEYFKRALPGNVPSFVDGYAFPDE